MRTLFWGLLLLVVLVAGTYLFLQSGLAHRRAVALTVARLSQFLQRDVTVGSVDYDFFPLAFELHDVVVPGPRPSDPPVARVPLVRAQFSWRDLRERIVRLEQIEVLRPQIYIRLNPDGTTNLPELRARGGGQSRFRVEIGRILVQDGVLGLDELRLPLDIDARAVWGRLVGGRTPDGKVHLEGLVTAQELVTTLPKAKPYPTTLSAKGSFEPGRIRLGTVRFSGPDLQAQVNGSFAWQGGGKRQLALQAVADGSARLAGRLGYVHEPIDGPFHFDGRFDLRDRDWGWSGNVSLPRFRYENRVLTAIAARLVGSREDLVVNVDQARYAQGALEGRVTVHIDETRGAKNARGARGDGKPVDVDLDFRGLDIQALLRDQFVEEGVPDLLASLSGGLTGELVYAFRAGDVLGGSGRVSARAQGVQALEGRIPLAGDLQLGIERGVVSGRDLQLAAPAQIIQVPRFTYDMNRGAAQAQYRIVTSDVGRLQPLFPTDPGEERPFWLPTRGQGTGEGTFEIHRGGYTATLAMDLRDVATPDFTAEALTGSLTIRPEAVEDLRIEARKGGGALRVAGRIPLEGAGRRPAPLAVDLEAERWSATEIAAFLMPPDFPDLGPIAGLATGRVALTGQPDALAGHADFTVDRLTIGRFAADTARGSLDLRPDAIDTLRVDARLGNQTLALAGRIPIGEGKGRAPGPPLTLDVRTAGWQTAALVPFLKIAELPDPGDLGGTVTGRLQLTVSGEAPNSVTTGRADARFEDLSWQGNPVGQVETAVAFRPEGITIEHGVIRTPAGEVVAQGSLGRGPGGDLDRLDLTVDAPALALDAEPLRRYLGGQISGQVSLAATVGGTLERPDAMLVLHGRDLELAGRRLGAPGEETEALVTWDGATLRATGSALGLATFEGGGRLDRRGADLSFDVSSSALGALARIASAQVPDFQGSLTGTLGYAADFQAGTHRGVVRLADIRVQYQGRTISNLEPVVAVVTPERLEIRSFYVGEPGTDAELFVAGNVGLKGGPAGGQLPLDLRFQGTLPLFWAELAVPGMDVDGRIELIGTAGGTVSDPQLNGLGEVRSAKLILPDFPQAVENIQGTVFLNRDALVFDGVRARMGGGSLQASGQVSWPRPGRGLSYQVNLAASDLSLRYPEGWLVRGDANLSLSPVDGGQQLRGEVRLERAFYLEDVRLGLADLLQGLLQRKRLQVPETEGFLATTQLNLAIEGPNALQVRNNVASLQGDIELTVRGTAASPVVFGRVEVDPGGTLVYQDNEYRIERGLLTFNNPYRIDPLIDLVARTEVRNFDITLNLAGTLERFNLGFSSNSDLADLDILSLLATGQETPETVATRLPNQPGQEGQNQAGAGQAARSFLYGQATSALTERVGNLFGFDRFRIDPLAAEAGQGLSGVSVTVGKRLSRDVFVTYTNNPSTEEEYVVQVEWRLSNGVTLVLTHTGRGEGTYAADVQWEKRF